MDYAHSREGFRAHSDQIFGSGGTDAYKLQEVLNLILEQWNHLDNQFLLELSERLEFARMERSELFVLHLMLLKAPQSEECAGFLGHRYREYEDYESAARYYALAAELASDHVADPVDSAVKQSVWLRNRAEMHIKLGRHPEAFTTVLKGLEIERRIESQYRGSGLRPDELDERRRARWQEVLAVLGRELGNLKLASAFQDL